MVPVYGGQKVVRVSGNIFVEVEFLGKDGKGLGWD